MKSNILSSVTIVKKIFFIILLASFSAILFSFLADEKQTASFFSLENKEIAFKNALEKNDEQFFIDISNEMTEKNREYFIENILKKYEKKMDISVFQKNNFLFYSFLGIKQNSTLLENVYGSWNAKTKKITTFDEITFSIMQQTEHSITITNNSNIAVPVKQSFILIPSEIKGEITFSEKLLLPGDSFIFTSEKNIPENIFQIESLYYGYKANIQ